MKICAIIKHPPIQGGVSAQSYHFAHQLALRGHTVYVVTNSSDVDDLNRIFFLEGDEEHLTATYPGGGAVFLRPLRRWDPADGLHIPQTNPTVTRLATVASEIVERHQCDIIYAYYLEPYGMAASLASQWTGVPYILRHAGSDRISLMNNPELSYGYKNILRRASGVLSSGIALRGFGIPDENIHPGPKLCVPEIFGPRTPAHDLHALTEKLRAAGMNLTSSLEIDVSRPVIGTYGKVGKAKGTFSLLKAVDHMRRRGTSVQLLLVGGGRRWPYVQEAIQELELADHVWHLPFLAPWQIPGIIRACHAVAYLEHGFPIREHSPSLPLEIMACGTPLVVSNEISRKPGLGQIASAAGFHFEVGDPGDAAELARGIESAVASGPKEIPPALEEVLDERRDISAAYEEAFTRVVEASRATTPKAIRSRQYSVEVEEELFRRLAWTRQADPEGLQRLVSKALPTVMLASKPNILHRTHALVEHGGKEHLAELRPFARELYLLEAHLLWLDVALDGEWAEHDKRLQSTAATQEPEEVRDDTRLRVSALVRAYRSHARPELIHKMTQRVRGEDTPLPGNGHDSLTAESTPYVFEKRHALGGAIYRVNADVIKILNAADGVRTVQELCRELRAAEWSEGDSRRVISQMIGRQWLHAVELTHECTGRSHP